MEGELVHRQAGVSVFFSPSGRHALRVTVVVVPTLFCIGHVMIIKARHRHGDSDDASPPYSELLLSIRTSDLESLRYCRSSNTGKLTNWSVPFSSHHGRHIHSQFFLRLLIVVFNSRDS